MNNEFKDIIDKYTGNTLLFMDFLLKSPIGIVAILVNEDFDILWTNEAFYETRGYTEYQLQYELNNKAIGLIHNEDRLVVKNVLFNAVKKNLNSVKLEFRIIQRNGSIKWVLVYFALFYIEGETIACLYDIDITRRKEIEEESRINKERYKIALTLTNSCVWEYDILSKCIYQTDQTFNQFGIEEEIIHNVPDRLIEIGQIHSDFQKSFIEMYEKIFRGEKTVEWIGKIKNSEGKYSWSKVIYKTIYNDNGKPVKAIGVSEDIDAVKSAEILYKQEMNYREAITSESIVSYEINIGENKILDKIHGQNTNFLDMVDLNVNCNYSIFLSRWAERLIHPDDKKYFLDSMSIDNFYKMFKRNVKEIQCDYRDLSIKGNDYTWVSASVHMIYDNIKSNICGFITVKDINDKKQSELKLKEKAEHDQLTGIYNRAAVLSIIEKSVKLKRKFDDLCTLVILDIDNFKNVNDTFGHSEGDRVLMKVAETLTNIYKNVGVVGRFGGDEFIIFINKNLSLEVLSDLARKTSQKFEMKSLLSNKPFFISCSVGLAFISYERYDFQNLYRMADDALYKAKQNGKACYYINNNEKEDIK